MKEWPHSLCRTALAGALGFAILAGCGDGSRPAHARAAARSPTFVADLSGRISVEGSSPLWRFTELVVRNFKTAHPRVWVRSDLSSAGEALGKLAADQIHVAAVDRRVTEEEMAVWRDSRLELLEFPIALGAIALVANAQATWIDHMRLDELRSIWEPGSVLRTWADVRRQWPADALHLVVPPPTSGLHATFARVIGCAGSRVRADCLAHEDENLLARSIASERGSMGVISYSWYTKYRTQLRLVPIQFSPDSAPEQPGEELPVAGKGWPLSCVLFVYVSAKAAEMPEVRGFVSCYLESVPALGRSCGLIVWPEDAYPRMVQRLKHRQSGSAILAEVEALWR